MSTSSLSSGHKLPRALTGLAAEADSGDGLWQVLKMLGSLKITVVAFFLSTLLVLFGTLAQDQQNLEEVKTLYFNSWLAIVPFDVFLPITIFPHENPIPFAFPFPGGATLGTVLMFNLFAAKLTRFKVVDNKRRQILGSIVALAGAALVTLVIISGQSAEGLQGAPPVSYDALWQGLRWGVYGLTLALLVFAVIKQDLPTLSRIAIWAGASLLVMLSVFLFFGGNRVRLDDPGMRIVWQLLQSGIASAVVLVGLVIVFGNRGGNFLIHVGVALMMLGQFIFGDRQIEQQMSLVEGQQTNMVFRQSELEIAIIDKSDTSEDSVFAIPEGLIRRAVAREQVIAAPELPFKLKILQWMPNSSVEDLRGKDQAIATTGIGMSVVAKPTETFGGATSRVNIASAYVELIDKQSDKSLGTILLSQFFNDQKQLFVGASADQNEELTLEGRTYDLALRFRRDYKPFQVLLENVERKNYEASDRARDFSSHVVIRDPEDGSELRGHIWMNNPVRYRNETFYQSKYDEQRLPDGSVVEMTGLQVVENSGWVIPYVSCMLVLFGMIAHFSGTFYRFASRMERGAIPSASNVGIKERTESRTLRFGLIAAALAVQIVVVYYMASVPKSKENEYDWYAASKLPAMHEGRIKPLDSVARHVLQNLSEPLFGMTPRVKDDAGTSRTGTAWLLALFANKEWVAEAPVFRIYSQEARDFFDLKPVSGYRYSYSQLKEKSDDLRQHLAKAPRAEEGKLSPADEKLADVMRKIQLYEALYFSYLPPPIPDEDDFDKTDAGRREFTSRLMSLMEYEQQIEASKPPALIPPVDSEKPEDGPAKWQAFSPAFFTAYISQKLGLTRNANPAIIKYTEIVDALRSNDPKKFNRAVSDYSGLISELKGRKVEVSKAGVETWLNKFNPTAIGVAFYLVAFILALLAAMTSSPSLRWTTFAVLLMTLVVHTIAIGARLYVSGRPPVVNLYSSAVFIGWACVVGALLLELIQPIGICNIVAAIIGAATLSIARSLDTSDTMHVLEAVLDTQFWLSTHVVTVAMGYGATFFAGTLGILSLTYMIMSRFRNTPSASRAKTDAAVLSVFSRMIYGVLCFAILFSFIGTVLGGLWADDSWGRFWGWDPKENGALMIVLWNALVLHANWDRMVGPRGLAVLAALGNIVTSWSWFGTNQLGIGLHSYGFTSTMLITLTLVVVGHLAFVIVSLWLTRPKTALPSES